MKLHLIFSLSVLSLAAFSCQAKAAEAESAESTTPHKKVMVAVKTDDVELHEMDISHLQPGDSETIVTEDGKTIDLLRTEDDVEIYIDGKLLDLGAEGDGQHKIVHARHENIEIDCTDETECEELLLHSKHGEDTGSDQHDVKKVVIIHKEVKTN